MSEFTVEPLFIRQYIYPNSRPEPGLNVLFLEDLVRINMKRDNLLYRKMGFMRLYIKAYNPGYAQSRSLFGYS